MPRKTKETNETNDIIKVPKKTNNIEKNINKNINEEFNTEKNIKQSVTKKETTQKSPTVKKNTSQSVNKKISTEKDTTVKKRATKTAKTTSSKKDTTGKKETNTKNTTSKTSKKSTTTSKIKKATKSSSTKTVLKKAQNKISVLEYYDLPYRYNQTVVKVLAQTPNNLFIYWDISDADIENYKAQYGENFFETTKPVLIIHNITMNYNFEIDINDFANSWYLHINDAKCDYKVELGRRPIKEISKINTEYIYITTSNNIETPNDHILFKKNQNTISFRNVKTGIQVEKPFSTNISYLKNISKLYNINNISNIYDIYRVLYQNENIEEIYNLSNPSSGNPSSSNPSSNFSKK